MALTDEQVHNNAINILQSNGSWLSHSTDERWTVEARRAIRRAAWEELKRLPGGGRELPLEDYRTYLLKRYRDYASEVFDRLTAAEFIRVEGTKVHTHPALPAPVQQTAAPKPEPVPEPAPAEEEKPAPADPLGDVGDLASFSEPEVEPKTEPAPATSDVELVTLKPDPVEPVIEETTVEPAKSGVPELKPAPVQQAPAPVPVSSTPSPSQAVAKTAPAAGQAAPTTDYSRQVAEDIHAMRVRADEEAARRDEEERERQELLAMDALTRRYLKKLIVLLACDGGKARQLTRNQLRRGYISSSMATALNRVIALAVDRGAVADKERHGVILLTHRPVMSDSEFETACAERKAARKAEENAA